MPVSSTRRGLSIVQALLLVTTMLLTPLQGAVPAIAAPPAAPEAAPVAHPSLTELFRSSEPDVFAVFRQAAGIGPGICSNNKAIACTTNADCGAGNTCYVATAGGQTLSNQVCMQTAAGQGLNCTANDVNLAATTSLNVVDKDPNTPGVQGCLFPGDTATISFVGEFNLTAQDRYDIGVWVAQDGGNALTGSCSVSDFPISPTPPWTNLDASGQPTDTCGDITSTNNPLYSSIQNIQVACVDANGDGNLDINTCLSWQQPGSNGVCTSPVQAFPGSPSKCRCQTLPGIAIPVPGVIKVDKVTYQADGTTPKPGDPTSFPFALTGGPNNINTPFNLKDADPLYNSGGLSLGTYAVSEGTVSGWTMFSATCTSDQAGRTPTPGNIVLHNGETVTCTFKNKVAGAAPALTVTKDNDANHDGTFSDAETVPGSAAYPYAVTYRATIVNSSITAATITSITDNKTATLTTPVSGKTPTCASLVGTTIGANSTLTCYYDVSFANADTAQVVNTVTVAATNSFGTDTKSDTSTVNFTQAPALSLTKSANPLTYGSTSVVINYTYVVKNTGNVTLPGPFTITDDKLGAVSCPAGSLAPNATVTCTATHTITQADLDAGSIVNKATASTTFGGNTVTSNQATATVTAVQNPHISLTKTADKTSFNATGQVINYTLVATNDGNITLHDVSISDPKLGTLTCAQPATLAPGATLTCTGSHTVTQTDLDAGRFDNTASVSGKGPQNQPVSATASASVPASQAPHLALTKSTTTTSFDHVGQVIVYTLVATNDGNVTLTNVSISDPKLGALTCTQPVTLAPGGTLTCTGSHTVTQADLDAGTYDNTATASGTDPNGQPVSATASKSVPAAGSAHLALTKVADTTTYDHVGQVINYTLAATNDGNVTLTGVSISDPMFASLTCTPAQPATLAPTQKLTCTGTRTVTQGDLDAGSISNTANAAGKDPTNKQVNAQPASVTVTASQNPHMTLAKTADRGSYDTVGQVIKYTLVATNDGNVTLHAVSITDAALGALSCTPTLPATLAPGQALTCTGSHTITQADLDAGSFHNTATATGLPPAGTPPVEPPPATVTVPAVQNPHISLTKSADLSGYNAVGQLIQYTLAATNDGNVTLHDVSISDPKLGTLTCAQPATLAPGETLTCTGSHTVTQADLDARFYSNTATANGTGPMGQPVSDVASVTVPGIVDARMTLTKIADRTSYDAVNQVIVYTLVATNVGNVTLSNVSISDPELGALTCTQPVTLAPGGTLTCTGSHTVTQADLDAGSFHNTATATGTPPSGTPIGPPPAEVTVPAVQNPHISLTKAADLTSFSALGDVINYTLVATNDGNVTLHGVEIVDTKLGALTCDKATPVTLAPAEKLTCTGSHTVTQGDLNAGSFDNTATTSGNGPQDQPVSDTASKSVPASQTPHLSLTKVAAPKTYSAVGDIINYTLEATNDGNVTLTDVSISDPMFASLNCTPAQPATLAPTEKLTCTGSHTITQIDLDAGSITNTAKAAGKDPNNQPVNAPPASETVDAIQSPHITLAKSTTTASFDHAGQVIVYTLVATNDGNVTLSNVSISDPKLGTLACNPTQPATLAPGGKLTCTGSHTVTQADLDAGMYENTANVTGRGPQDQPVSDTDSQTVPGIAKPGMTLTKTASPTSYSKVGDVIAYTLVATNVGNVTLSNVSISDSMLASLSCTPVQPATLAPTEKLTCTGSHTITQADLDAGSLHNAAAAAGTPPSGPPVTPPPAEVTVPAVQNPHISLAKTPNPTSFDHVGQVINYTLVATNDGNVTLSNVLISDPKLGALTCTQPVTLAPGQMLTCTGSHTVTQADLNAGKYENTAGVSGTGPQGQPVSDTDTATVTGIQQPHLTLAKVGVLDMTVVAPADRADPGDKINYTLTATNVGNVTLNNVTITDPKLGTLSCTPTQPATLDPGASMVCIGSYTLVLADINAGKVDNTATADSDQTPPTDTPNEVPVPKAPHLTVTKSGVLDMTVVAPADRADVGDVIHYTITVLNDGNQTLTGVGVTDATLGALACTPAQPATLDPGKSMVCTGSYTLKQADINAGNVHNVAIGTSNEYQPPEMPNDVPVPKAPSLNFTKVGTLDMSVVAPVDRADVGDKINYTLTATNTGNETLTNVQFSDPLLGTLTCNPAQPATLAPTEKLTCTGTYVLTQADIDAGNVHNVAVGKSDETPPTNTPTDVPVPQAPAIALAKSVQEKSFTNAGDVLHYTLVSTNIGNVTLSNVSISDPLLGALTCTPDQPAILAPAATLSCTGSYTVKQSDVDAGHVANTATATGSFGGKDYTATDSKDVPASTVPHLTLTKTATPHFSNPAKAGDTIDYTLTAVNDDSVTLNNVTITDAKLGTLTCNPTQPATLGPTQSLVCTGTYVLTQADIDAGHVANTAFATSKLPGGGDGPGGQDSQDVPVPQSPALTLTKSASPTTYDAVGQKITYSYVIKNTGNVTLPGPFTVTDDKATVTCNAAPAGGLAPNATLSCSATYSITQADLDAGKVTNTATAKTSYGANDVTSNQAQATVTAVQNPAITLTKSANPTLYSKVGDVINYTLVAKNTGNVTLSNVSISDPKLGTLTCTPTQPATLAPNATLTCTGKYTIQASDLVAGQPNKVTNTATVTGTSPANKQVTATASATVYQQTGALLPTQTTCQQYAAGPSAWPAMYSAFQYQVKSGKINSVSPGVIFYYNTITAPSASFTLNVVETNSLTWNAMLWQDSGQAILYTANCSKASRFTVSQSPTKNPTSPYTISFNVTGATPGATYYIGIKYSPANLVGQSVKATGGVYPTSIYAWDTTGIPGSKATIPVAPK